MIQNVANIAHRKPRSRRTANPYIAGAHGEKNIFRHPQSVLPRKPTTIPQIQPIVLRNSNTKALIIQGINCPMSGNPPNPTDWPLDDPSSCARMDSRRFVTKNFSGCCYSQEGSSASTRSNLASAPAPLSDTIGRTNAPTDSIFLNILSSSKIVFK